MRRRALALLIGLGLALFAELGLRALGFGWRPQPFRLRSGSVPPESDPRLVTHPERVYALAPHQHALPGHAGRYALEDWPFRGRPATPAPRGLTRVVFLGDSCVFGSGVDPSETLPHQVEGALASAGLGPERVQVLNLGVPGYSLEQIRLVLAQVLDELAPCAAVFYVGAWNDQAPIVREDDQELLARRTGWRGRLRTSALVDGLERRRNEPSFLPEVETGPTSRPRVPEERFAALLEECLLACRSRGVWPLVVAPAHPAATAETAPRTRRDAATCLRVATDLGVACLDAQELLEAVPEESRFLDLVHMAPPALATLAGPVARALAPHLAAASASPPAEPVDPAAKVAEPLVIVPARATTFGDVTVRMQSPAFAAVGERLTVVVGGAVVLDLERRSPTEYTGLLPANGPGAHALVVQGERGVLVFPDAVTYELPALRIEGKRLVVHAPPGARAVVGGSAGLVPARFSPQGGVELDPARAWPNTLTLTCDARGDAQVDMGAYLERLDTPAYLQGIFSLPCTSNEQHLGRWSNVAVLEPRR